jgi:phospholipid/cholesterol/gamma-HCH transport system permease protein
VFSRLIDIIDDIGRCVLFCGLIAGTGWRTPCRFDAIAEQVWKVSVQSLVTTALAGFFVGAIMTLQFSLQVREFGALGYLGGLATSGTIREVGPLLIAFMLSGKVGAFTSAELGTMRVTEQIDAIRCLGAFFLLTAGLFMSIAGGMVMGRLFAGINAYEYVRHIPTIVNSASIATGLFKCVVFAILLAAICTYKGYHATGGAKGVGRAVIQTAVSTMVGIVIADWLTSLLAQTALDAYLQGVAF